MGRAVRSGEGRIAWPCSPGRAEGNGPAGENALCWNQTGVPPEPYGTCPMVRREGCCGETGDHHRRGARDGRLHQDGVECAEQHRQYAPGDAPACPGCHRTPRIPCQRVRPGHENRRYEAHRTGHHRFLPAVHALSRRQHRGGGTFPRVRGDHRYLQQRRRLGAGDSGDEEAGRGRLDFLHGFADHGSHDTASAVSVGDCGRLRYAGAGRLGHDAERGGRTHRGGGAAGFGMPQNRVDRRHRGERMPGCRPRVAARNHQHDAYLRLCDGP